MVSTQPHGLNVCNLRFVFVNALIAPICCLSLSFSFSICLSGSWIKKDEDYFFYSWRVCVACLALITVFYTDISCFDSSRNSGECLHIPMYLNRQERERRGVGTGTSISGLSKKSIIDTRTALSPCTGRLWAAKSIYYILNPDWRKPVNTLNCGRLESCRISTLVS